MSKAYDVNAAEVSLHRRDPRWDFVTSLRESIDKRHSVLATERMAAHFWDYHRIYTGKRLRMAGFVVIDRMDQWDKTGLSAMAETFQSDGNYRLYAQQGDIVVFERVTQLPDAD